MKPLLKSQTITLAIILTAVLCIPQQSVANANNRKPDTVRIFGDSLVDNGNLLPVTWLGLAIPPLTRYDRGRFTNGLTAVEHFSNRLDIPVIPAINGINFQDSGINWGIGGSTTAVANVNPGGLLVAGLLGQIAEYEAALDAAGLTAGEVTSDNKILFIIWTAHNNYYIPLYNGSAPDGDTVDEAIGDIEEAVTRLHARGAQTIVVANIPDLGLPPICNNLGPGACDLLTDMTNMHNADLGMTLDTLEDELEGLTIFQFDVRSIFDEIINHSDEYGFANVVNEGPASGCLFEVPFNPFNCVTPVNFRNSGYFWWDEQHPDKKVHQILGVELYDLVTKKKGWPLF